MKALALTFALSLACGLLLAAPQASADPAPAEAAFATGVKMFDAKDYAGASEAFSRAYVAEPSEKALWNLALSEIGAGQFFAALNHLRDYKGRSDTVRTHLDAVDDLLSHVRRHVGHLAIEVPIDNFYVYVDGEIVGKSPLPFTVDVDPDRSHIVRAEDEHMALAEMVAPTGPNTVTVSVGSIDRLDDTSSPPSAAPSQMQTLPTVASATAAHAMSPDLRGTEDASVAPRNIAVIGAGALAVASLATAIGFDMAANNATQNAAEFQRAIGTRLCSPSNALCAGLAGDEQTHANDLNWSTGFYIASAGLAIASLVTLIAWPHRHEGHASAWLIPSASAHGGRVMVGATF